MKRPEGELRPRSGNNTRALTGLHLVKITENVEGAVSLTELTFIVETLFEHEGGKTYPWSETPDEIIEAMRSYLASGQSDGGALARVPETCALRSRFEALYPPLAP